MSRPGPGDFPPGFVTTTDGRRLAYARFGDPAGLPCVYLHGFPSSRREAALLDRAATAQGIRVIAPDRPGLGASDHAPGRRLMDWPADCLALADGLGLERFGVVGVSGGGPYALACAWALPRLAPGRLAACTLVAPLGPVYRRDLLGAMRVAPRLGLGVARLSPKLADLVYGGPTAAVMTRWPGLVEWVRELAAPPPDRRVLRAGDNAAILNTTIEDAMDHGAPGARRDLAIYTRDWGLPFPEIDFPVRIWHGDADGTVPIAHGRWYAARLPNATLTEVPGEGHYSLPILHAEAILAAVRAAIEVTGP